MYKNTHLDRDTSHLYNIVNTQSIPKQSRWLSKDRFWNFVFWFGMSGGITLSFSVPANAQAQYKLSTILILLTILVVPLLVRHFSKTTFIKDTLFLNKEGELLNAEKDTPNAVLTIISTVILTAITGAILDKYFKGMSNIASSFIILNVFFGVTSLFFIFKNCPIAILFNCKMWKFEPTKYCISSSENYYNRNAAFRIYHPSNRNH
jgi:hypothetical protein